MKNNDFDDLLRSAREDFLLPPSFHTEVWSRIESAEVIFSQIGTPWHHNVISMIARPWAAASGLAAMVGLGLWLGALSIPDTSHTETAYALSISPFAQSHP
jgi:hypothetical protein